MHYIDGTDRYQTGVFTSLEDQISDLNYIRLIDLIADFFVGENSDFFQQKGQSISGRKAYPASTLLKIYVYGYFNGISSSRKLERECQRNIEMMWLTHKLIPDHKTISDFRCNNGKAIRAVMVKFNQLLKESGYIRGKLVSIDGSKIKANADMCIDPKLIENKLDDIESQIDRYLERLQENDQEELELEQARAEKQAILDEIDRLKKERDKLEEHKHTMMEKSLKRLNTTDPDSRVMKGRGGKHFSYNFQAVIDSEHHMIGTQYVSDQENDFKLLVPAVDQLKQELHIVPHQVLADSGYFTGSQIELLEKQRDIDCYVPVHLNQQQHKRNKAKTSFNYNADKDEYICSLGKRLVPRGGIKIDTKRGTEAQLYVGIECQGCCSKSNCTTAKEGKTIYRYSNQDWKDNYQMKMNSVKGKEMMKRRKLLSEHPFGTIKYLMGQIPILLRGINKVQVEMDLYTIAYNLKRLLHVENYRIIETLVKTYSWKVA